MRRPSITVLSRRTPPLSLLLDSAAKLPDNPQVQYHLRMTYAQLGDQANARKALNVAIGSPADFQGKDEPRKTRR